MDCKKMSKGLKTYFLVLLAIVFTLLFPKTVFAQVVINEFSSNSDPEWVELYNNSDSPVDISDWSLKDETQPSKLLTGTIIARGYFVFETSSGWLNNSGGDTITLFNNVSPLGQVDQVIYGKSDSVVGTPASDKSAGRTPDGSSTWQSQLTWTKLAANPAPPSPIPSPASYSNIYLSEFLPDPESGNEKVEIKNGNNYAITLSDWKIDDKENEGHDPLTFSAEISASGLYVVDLGNGFLNNDNDSVRILDFNGVEKDRRDYSSSTRNLSWAKDHNSNWCQQSSSFGSDNSDCPSATDAPTATPVPASTPTSTPIPTPIPTIKPSLTPTKTPTPTISLSLTATPSGEILGEETASRSGLPQLSDEESKVSNSNEGENKRNLIFPAVAAVLGLAFIGFSIFSFLKGRRPKEEGEEVVV